MKRDLPLDRGWVGLATEITTFDNNLIKRIKLDKINTDEPSESEP